MLSGPPCARLRGRFKITLVRFRDKCVSWPHVFGKVSFDQCRCHISRGKIMSRHRKDLGSRGEHLLDQWAQSQRWQVISKNLKLRSGEIDRVYQAEGHLPDLLVCEVKTLWVGSLASFDVRLGGDFLIKSLKPHQCKKLLWFAKILSHRERQRVHVRVVRVFVCASIALADKALKIAQERFSVAENRQIRILTLEGPALALSLRLECVPQGMRSSPLQIEME
jgi:Holliday junction resolvase-like predicted endonuclease